MKFLSLFTGKKTEKSLQNVPAGVGGGWMRIMEAFPGAWQRNIELKRDTLLAYHAIFACITLIASDIAKMPIQLVKIDKDGIWNPIDIKDDFAALKKPNLWQNRIQFFENWLTSKLSTGNAYILKRRTTTGKIKNLYVLNPNFVLPLISDSGEVFYQLTEDRLTDVERSVIVPASEIIHDRFNCLFHPLIGLSPILASGLAAHNGQKIQTNSAWFFENMSQPGGIITVPGNITAAAAELIKTQWQERYSGENAGKVAVLGDSMTYTASTPMTAEQSQMVEQLKLSSEIVCSTFHVPPYKVIGDAPNYNNIEALDQSYYSQCLQVHIESMELALDEGFDLEDDIGVQFDLDCLLRMDTNTQIKTLKEGVSGSLYSPNEARKKLNLKSVEGGNSPMSQQQNFSLSALAKRDAQDDPFKSASTNNTPPAGTDGNNASGDQQEQDDKEARQFTELLVKGLSDVA